MRPVKTQWTGMRERQGRTGRDKRSVFRTHSSCTRVHVIQYNPDQLVPDEREDDQLTPRGYAGRKRVA